MVIAVNELWVMTTVLSLGVRSIRLVLSIHRAICKRSPTQLVSTNSFQPHFDTPTENEIQEAKEQNSLDNAYTLFCGRLANNYPPGKALLKKNAMRKDLKIGRSHQQSFEITQGGSMVGISPTS